MPDFSAVLVPQESANDEFTVVVEWPLPSGSPVKAGELIVVLENSKTAFEVTAEQDGYLHYRLAPNDKVAVGDPVAYIADEPTFSFPEAAPAPAKETAPKGERRASAKAAKLMREQGLGLADFPDLGLVRESDVQARLAQAKPAGAPAKAPLSALPFRPLAQPPSKAFEIAQLRAASAEAIPSSVVVPVLSEPVTARLDALAEDGGAVSVLELVIHSLGGLLSAHPHFNAFFRDERAYAYEQTNIGFAVNLGRGLKVPVVKAVDQKSLEETAVAVKDLVLRYARDQLAPADLRDGSFTVTDLSLLQVSFFQPVLPRDQAAILGICAPAPGSPAFNLILGFDHRLADGMAAARLLNELREELEG